MRKMTLDEFLRVIERQSPAIAFYYRELIKKAEYEYERDVELPDIQKKIEEAGENPVPPARYVLTVQPGLSIKERHRLEKAIELLGYSVVGGGGMLDGSGCNISFVEIKND